MRTIFHIGAPKTGTTAIQSAFAASRETLLQQGICYPKTVRNVVHHGFFAASFQPRLSRGYKFVKSLDPDLFDLDIERQSAFINDAAVSGEYETLIVSSEDFFFDINFRKNKSGFDTIRTHSDSFIVAAYVRSPADHYLSIAQQTLKASHLLPEPLYRMQPALSGWASVFPNALVVRSFQQDVVADFCEAFLTDKQVDIVQQKMRKNETISSEAMCLLQEYRRENFPDAPNTLNRETTAYLTALQRADRSIEGYKKPVLRQSIIDAVEALAGDAYWLRDNMGIQFEGFDYNPNRKKPQFTFADLTVMEICHVDRERLDVLRAKIFKLHPMSDINRTGMGDG
ncbi:hypothetical protein [Hyphomonas chukchiensis]|uniref:hypothetical protein n=1 Tax=Hyphomonas chukchiensis TaxID=1280947 RepID=UPI0030FAD3F7